MGDVGQSPHVREDGDMGPSDEEGDPICIDMLSKSEYVPDLNLVSICRVGEGTLPLAIVVYIDGSFVKHKIPVKPIYVTVRNLNSTVSGKACALRVLGMMPSVHKSATLEQTESLRRGGRITGSGCITLA